MQFNEFYKKYFKLLRAFLSALFWALIIFAFETPREALATLTAAIIHEAGHVCYALIFLRSEAVPYGVLSGLRIGKSHVMSYRDELFLYLSGPLFNLLTVFILLPACRSFGGFAGELCVMSLFTMISNLLPIAGYDGYGALMATASILGFQDVVRPALEWISFSLTAIMTLVSLYLMYYLDGGYWIFAIFSISTLSFIKKSLKTQNQRF